MKEDHIQQFRTLSKTDLADVLAEAQSAPYPLGQRLATLSQERHPGEVSHVQMDLTTLVLSGVSAPLLLRPTRIADPLLLGPKHLGRFGVVRLAEEPDSKTTGSVRVCFGSAVEAAMGGSIAAIYPFKIVSKKTSRLTLLSLTSQSSVVLPAANKEVASCRIQLALLAEVLLNNRIRVVEMVKSQPEDLTLPLPASEFPSPLRVLHEVGWLHCFFKKFEARVVDEFDELMFSVTSVGRPRSGIGIDETGMESQTLQEIDSDLSATIREEEKRVLESEDGPEYLQSRNSHFLFGKTTVLQGLSLEEQQKERVLVDWSTDDSDGLSCLFDTEIKQLLQEGLITHPETLLTVLKSRNQTGIGDQKTTKTSDLTPIEYRYFEFHFERAEILSPPTSIVLPTIPPSRPHKQSRDEHLEVEVSTKSDEGLEEHNLPLPLESTLLDPDQSQDKILEHPQEISKSQKKKRNKKAKKREKESLVETVVEVSETDSPFLDKRFEIDLMIRETLLPNSIQTSLLVPVPSLSFPPHRSILSFPPPSLIPARDLFTDLEEEEDEEEEPCGSKEQNKLQDKLKQESKDFLRSQLSRVISCDNLDDFEKICLTEINSLDSLSKKMKQKARKRLRQEVESEKMRRELAQEQQMDEFEDEEFEYEDVDCEYSGQDLYLPNEVLKNIRLPGARLMLGQRTLPSPRPKKTPKKETRDMGVAKSRKWKDGLLETIERLDEELHHHSETIQKADTLNSLYLAFRDSHFKSLLNILHEGSMALSEPVSLERRKKMPQHSLLLEEMFE